MVTYELREHPLAGSDRSNQVSECNAQVCCGCRAGPVRHAKEGNHGLARCEEGHRRRSQPQREGRGWLDSADAHLLGASMELTRLGLCANARHTNAQALIIAFGV